MATALVLGLGVVGGVALLSKYQEDLVMIGPDAPTVDLKAKTVARQREWGYVPSAIQPPTNPNNNNRTIMHLKGDAGDYDPAAVADVYAAAQGQRTKELAAEAFSQTDHGIVVPNATVRNPLFIPLSSQGKGNMANYPLSYFEARSNQDPIDSRQDIFTDPWPKGFPGPARDIVPRARAPDRLRNPWGPDGLISRSIQQSRRPAVPTRPTRDNQNPRSSYHPVTPHPWARKVARPSDGMSMSMMSKMFQ